MCARLTRLSIAFEVPPPDPAARRLFMGKLFKSKTVNSCDDQEKAVEKLVEQTNGAERPFTPFMQVCICRLDHASAG